MQIYCDESGGVGNGVMLLAAVTIDDADALLTRVRAVLGLKGELKGSRLTLPERAFVIELFARMGGRAAIAEARTARLAGPDLRAPRDDHVYAALLDSAIDHWMLPSGGCIDVTIDDGRYDQLRNMALRDTIQHAVGQWGRATLADSKKSAGIQIADVIANSHFHVAVGSNHARRIDALLAPFWADGRLVRIAVDRI